jgi:hypothetical protein
MTVYLPKGKNTGAAVVVFPGGGYKDLAIDLEGTEVCDWLTSKRDYVCAVEIRAVSQGFEARPYPKSGPYPESAMALEDAQRTVGSRALSRCGVAHRSAQDRSAGVFVWRPSVGSDEQSFCPPFLSGYRRSRQRKLPPDFAVAIYPGHLSLSAAEWDAKQGTKKFVVHHPATADKDLALNP